MLGFIYFNWLKLELFTLTHFRLVYKTAPPAVTELDWTGRAAYARTCTPVLTTTHCNAALNHEGCSKPSKFMSAHSEQAIH